MEELLGVEVQLTRSDYDELLEDAIEGGYQGVVPYLQYIVDIILETKRFYEGRGPQSGEMCVKKKVIK